MEIDVINIKESKYTIGMVIILYVFILYVVVYMLQSYLLYLGLCVWVSSIMMLVCSYNYSMKITKIILLQSRSNKQINVCFGNIMHENLIINRMFFYGGGHI